MNLFRATSCPDKLFVPRASLDIYSRALQLDETSVPSFYMRAFLGTLFAAETRHQQMQGHAPSGDMSKCRLGLYKPRKI